MTMPRKVPVNKQSALRTVPFESGFHFYTEIGSYTGITATNLSEFAAKLKNIPAESVTFHFYRKDFQKWIKNTIKSSAGYRLCTECSEAVSCQKLEPYHKYCEIARQTIKACVLMNSPLLHCPETKSMMAREMLGGIRCQRIMT